MKPSVRIAGLLAALSLLNLPLAGCNSQGGGGSTAFRYAGTWRGTFADPLHSQQGTLFLTIDGQGNVTGQVTNANNQSGNVTGSINNGGAITLTYNVGGQTIQAGAMAQVSDSGHMVTYVPSMPGGGPPILSSGITTLTYDLTRQ